MTWLVELLAGNVHCGIGIRTPEEILALARLADFYHGARKHQLLEIGHGDVRYRGKVAIEAQTDRSAVLPAMVDGHLPCLHRNRRIGQRVKRQHEDQL